mgnify:FL=1
MIEPSEIIERINFYIRQKGGNKSALARDWGISPSHLGVVLKGTRQVSATMLKNALAQGYNTEWLLTGEGSPYLASKAKEIGLQTSIFKHGEDYRDELISSKDDVIALLRKENERLEQELLTKKVPGVATKKKSAKIVHFKTING